MTLPTAVLACRTWGIAAVVVTALAAASCSTRADGREWIRRRPPEAFYVKWDELTPDRAREVPPELREEAVALLNAESGRLLSEEEVRRFVPRASVLGGRWYLLRAVRSPNDDGSLHVLTRGRSVAVVYRTPSARHDTVKSAVAAYLEASPEAPYVELSTAR